MSLNVLTGYHESSAMPQRVRDVLGRLKVAIHQNIYDADFEYGTQPLRWEAFTSGLATVAHAPGKGGVKMSVTTASGDICIRQSRPYHRYQPGKSMFMATACQLGTALTNNVTRVGFFDDGNGAFFEQGTATSTNPFGMAVVIRSDSNGSPTDTRFALDQWNGDQKIIKQLDFNRIQMFWIEYAWYGAGATRFGFWIDGEPVIAHQIGWGNYISPAGVPNQQPWARTGNLPVRYEQRNTGIIAQANDLFHYGVSVLVEGGQDDQRGFTYSYGMDPIVPVRAVTMAASSPVRKPVLSIRSKAMGLVEYSQASTGTGVAGTTGSTTGTASSGTTTSLTVSGAAWVVDYWKGRYVYFPTLIGSQGGTGSIARITSNTATTLTFADNITGGALNVTPGSGASYSIGLLNRGQLLPKKLYVVQTTASVNCTIEIVASTPTSPVTLTGASFVALSGIGSPNSFAERDVAATAMTGGEVTFAFPLNAGAGIQEIDLSYFFPMLNTIRGNQMDILTVSVAGPANTAYTVGASLICQEAMS
jgi:hypothetical protein